MNLNAYDTITDKVDKTKSWINITKHLLLSREIKFRKYYVLSKRFNTETKVYDYFVILLDEQPTDRVSYNTRLDDYGRVKIRLHELYNESDLANLEKDTNQYFAVLTDVHSVGVMGDARTYGVTIALRAVTTDDFMTADWTILPYEVLAKASNRITNEVKGVSRVVYDITSKPPATVEWE